MTEMDDYLYVERDRNGWLSVCRTWQKWMASCM